MAHQENMISVLLCLVLIYAGTTDGYMDNKCPCHVDDAQHVANCTFRNFTSVPECIPNDTIVLLLSGNDIDSLDTGVFERFNNMKMLFLDYNNLDHLQEGVFSNLSHLQILSFAHNDLFMFNVSYPDNIFEPLINLKQLYIMGNHWPDASYPDKALSVLSTLEYLYLDGLDKPLGKGFSKLVKLNTLRMDSDEFGDCFLGQISPETFKNIQSLPVTDIELSECSFRSILPNSFKGFTKLRNLTMPHVIRPGDTVDFNGFTNITIGLNTTDIKMLNLSFIVPTRKTSIVWENTFNGISNTTLEILDLSMNLISIISSHTGLPSTLKYISLQKNFINDISFLCSSGGLKALEVIDFSFQYIYSIFDKTVLTHMPHLYRNQHPESERYINGTDKVTLPKFNTTHILYENVNKCYFPRMLKFIYSNSAYIKQFVRNKPVRFTPNSLQHFDLSNNQLTEVPGPWYGLHNLQLLDFSGNYIAMIPPNAFSDMNNLTTLDLGDNRIKYLERNMFQSQQKLKMLSLANNPLTSINCSLNYMTSLELFNISSNMLTTLSEKNTAELDQIAEKSNLTVDMTGNRLHCNCENIEFAKWFSKTKVQLFNKQHLYCKFENDTLIETVRIDDIYEDLTYICNVWRVLISVITTFVALLLILSLIAVMCYRSWKLNYWYYIGRKIVNPYHALDEEMVQFKYDVYISYDPCYDIFPDLLNLDDFVKQTVLPRLKDRGFIAIIRDSDDLQPGRGICDVISEALRGSRKVIAFVSEGYCSDYWNTFEFNMAVHEGMYTKRDVVIPIKFGDNLYQSLNQEMALFLKSDNYPTFTGNRNNIDQILDYLEDKIRQ